MPRPTKYVLALLLPAALSAQDTADVPAPPGAVWDAAPFVFDTVAPGVYQARGTGALTVGSNAAIIEGPQELIVVDSHITPAAAWALSREVRALTGKAIGTVINTHFHFDHSGGNQVYPPGVEIIGHEFTHRMIEAGHAFDGRSYHFFLDGLPDQIERTRAELAELAEDTARARVQRTLTVQERFAQADSAIVPTVPTLTLSDRMTLFRGEREIQILHPGRAHTAGDVVVYLPEERVLMTGDLLLQGIPFMGDAYVADWVGTLRALAELDVDVVVPGHGEPFTDPEVMVHLGELLADLWDQAAGLHAEGVPVDQALDRIDLSGHNANYRNPQAAVSHLTLQRIYDVLNGNEEGGEFTGGGA